MVTTKDIVILGGGIAGLWLLNRLRAEGYQAVLLEESALGNGQSIASQGMIHGGLKYALGGMLTGAAQAIADMPAHWKNCLDGSGDVDLRGTKLLSDTYYMWPRNSLRSRLTAFFGSKAVQGKVDRVSPNDFPAFFRGHIEGPLYRLQDIVFDVPSLLSTLANNCRGHIHRIDWQATSLRTNTDGGIDALVLPNGVTLQAACFISTCGAGNEALIARLASGNVAMQRRPLRMVVVKHVPPHPVYVHCVSDQFTATPEVTITSHRCSDGTCAWYLGGELAESGAERDDTQQIQAARDKLAGLFPWCDFSSCEFRTFPIDRAEARQGDGKRPDAPSILAAGNLLYCWPTKLTLAPNLATRVLDQLRARDIRPSQTQEEPLQGLPFPGLAVTPWDAA